MGISNVFARASVLLGGVPVLAERLDVPIEQLSVWIADPTRAPEATLATAHAIVAVHETDNTGTLLIKVSALTGRRARGPKNPI